MDVPETDKSAGRGPYIVEPTQNHTRTAVLLHGLGSNGEKFGKELLDIETSAGPKLPQLLPSVRWIFPTARRSRATGFGRSMLTQWCDVVRLDRPEYRQETQITGLVHSVQQVLDSIRKEAEAIPARNIILGGISQGCAASLVATLCLHHRLGGYVGISGWLPFRHEIEMGTNSENEDEENDLFARSPSEQGACEPPVSASACMRELLGLEPLENPSIQKTAHLTPVFLGHGEVDNKVPVGLGLAASRAMGMAGYEVEWHSYPGCGRWYEIPQEIDDIVEFIRSKVGWELSLS